jgi:hypothetical protein
MAFDRCEGSGMSKGVTSFVLAVSSVLILSGTVGCATKGEVEALRAELADTKQIAEKAQANANSAALEARNASQTAKQAAQTAEGAARDAQAAAATAQEASAKAEKVFSKSLRK